MIKMFLKIEKKLKSCIILVFHWELIYASWNVIGLFTMTNCPISDDYLCNDAKMTAKGMSMDKQWYGDADICFVDVKGLKNDVIEFILPLIERPKIIVPCNYSNKNKDLIFNPSCRGFDWKNSGIFQIIYF